MKTLARRALAAFFRSGPGSRALASAVGVDPEIAIAPLRRFTAEGKELADVRAWPERIDGFEDLAFLFMSSELNFRVALLGIDEAALLYRLGRSLPAGSTVVEIGRLRGGSTLLLAAATRGESDIWSLDLHDPLFYEGRETEIDDQLRAALDRYGLGGRVRILVEDSGTAEHPPGGVDLLWVDGDHSYEGVRRDYDHWREAVKPGGSLLFHDAEPGLLRTVERGVLRLVAEVERDDGDDWERLQGAGSIAHFRRKTAPKPDWPLR